MLIKYADNGRALYIDPLDSSLTYRTAGDGYVKFGAEARVYQIVK